MIQETVEKRIRRVLEKTYTDRMTVTVQRKIINQETKEVEFQPEPVLRDVPCRLSFDSSAPAVPAGEIPVYRTNQSVKIFLPPEIVLPPGSTAAVTREGTTTEYRQSGEPAVYPTHQEIRLELAKEYA